MRIPFLAFIFVFSLFKLAQVVHFACFAHEKDLPAEIIALKPVSFAEQQFALGRRIPLSIVDLYDLELIPNVSDQLGSNILEQRAKILFDTKSKTRKFKINPFELVHGVGKKTAEKLNRYLVLE